MKPLHVWPGQVWIERPDRTAAVRTFRVTGVHVDAQTVTEDQHPNGSATCQPIIATTSGGGRDTLQQFEARLADFAPAGELYVLISLDPAFPGFSREKISTPIGDISSEGDQFSFVQPDGTLWRTGPNGAGLFRRDAETGTWDEITFRRTQFSDLKQFGVYMHWVTFVGLEQ
jgi:hypothetical protein